MTRRPSLYAIPAFAVGAFLSWLVTADAYGRVLTHTEFGGLTCRVLGLDAVRVGDWPDPPQYVCIDLTYATPEQDLTDAMFERIRDFWSRPR